MLQIVVYIMVCSFLSRIMNGFVSPCFVSFCPDVLSRSTSCHRMKFSTDIVTSCGRSMVASLFLRIFPGIRLPTRKMAKTEKVGADAISLLGGDEFLGSSDSSSLPMSLLVVDDGGVVEGVEEVPAPLPNSW